MLHKQSISKEATPSESNKLWTQCTTARQNQSFNNSDLAILT